MKTIKLMTLITIISLIVTAAAFAADTKSGGNWAEQMSDMALRYEYESIGINYYEYGSGDPIVMLHGFGASAYSWRKIADPLAENHKVILIDLKGFGYSDKPDDDKYSAFDQAEIIAAFIRDQGLQNVTLLGNSYGGGIALFTYLRLMDDGDNPVARLILIDSAGYEQKIPSYIAVLRIPIIRHIVTFLTTDRFNANFVLKKAYFNDKLITKEMPTNYAAPMKTKGALSAIISAAKYLTDGKVIETSKRYKEIEVPTLLIWGEHDKIIPLFIGKRFDKEIPNSELHIFPECGHVPQEEKPDKVVKVIREFMKSIQN